MMEGLYIKDAKLPDACWNCGWDPCMLWNEDRGDLPKHPNCPLVEVPDHGELIDRDVFVDRVTDYSRISTREIGKALRATPTVIPADKEEV